MENLIMKIVLRISLFTIVGTILMNLYFNRDYLMCNDQPFLCKIEDGRNIFSLILLFFIK